MCDKVVGDKVVCVTKLCVCDKLVGDKVVCVRERCVKKLCAKELCLTKLCAIKLHVGERCERLRVTKSYLRVMDSLAA